MLYLKPVWNMQLPMEQKTFPYFLSCIEITIIGVDSLGNMIEKARLEEEKLHEYYRVSWRK